MFVALFFVAIIILATISWTAPRLASEYLRSQGYDLTFGQVSINIFRGRAQLEDVSFFAHDEKNGDESAINNPVHLNSIGVDVGIWELLKNQRLVVSHFTVDGLSVPIVKYEDHYRVANIDLTSQKAPEAKPETTPENSDAAEPPALKWKSINFKNIAFVLSDSASEADSLTITIKQFLVGRFNSAEPLKSTPFNANILVTESSLDVDGQTTILADSITGAAKLYANNLNTDLVKNAAKFLPEGTFDSDSISPLTANVSYRTAALWSLGGDSQSIGIENSQLDIHQFLFEQQEGDIDRSVSASGQIKINNISISPETSTVVLADLALSNSTIQVIEKHPQADIQIDLSELQLSIDAIDTSNTNQPSTLALSTNYKEFGKIEGNGSSTLLDPAADTKFTLTTNQVDLISISPIVESALGRSIDSGLLGSESNIVIQQRELDVKNKLRLDQLQLATLENQEGDEDLLELGIPLNTALNLLRDKNDRIQLELPVSGSIDDPTFKLQPIVNKALLKSIQTGVMTQVGPLLAVSALGKARDLKDALSLKPIDFSNGSSELNEAANDNILKLTQLMQKREKISIRLCPRITPEENLSPQDSDTGKLSDTGKKLGEERLAIIKQSLLSADINGQRIVPCAAKMIEEPGQTPYVQASF